LSSQNEWYFQCISCGWEKPISLPDPTGFFCERCGDLLQLVLRESPPDKDELFPSNVAMSVWKYSKALPVEKRVSLGEGGTPLLKSRNLGEVLGIKELYIKYDGLNPTGSFKDRGMTVAIARAIDSHAKILVCASTGNTSASLAAYAASGGLKSAVLVPEGKVAKGKLVQAVAYGAKIIKVNGSFDTALEMVEELVSKDKNFYLMNSINPFRVEGQKTTAYEIYEQLGGVPDYVVLPVGNAGNISAIWKGFKELKEWGIAEKVPHMIGVQAEGAAPIAEAVQKGYERPRIWSEPETKASAIRIGNPVSWKKAMNAIKESEGSALTVSDSEILESRRKLAAVEGIFAEAASASPIAALSKMGSKDGVIVCIATGNGLKDQELIEWDTEQIAIADNAETLRRIMMK